ncbi:15553_t:CDS:1, partial [Rhizophagus irregularis]
PFKTLDSDSKSDQFNPFYLVIDDVDDKRAASVNALDDLAMPSSNTQSSNNDKLKKESTLSAPAVDSSAPATIQTSDL